MRIIAPHSVDTTTEHYAAVSAYMREHGAPTIRAWWDESAGVWLAVEGSHRLAIAHATGVEPVIDDAGQSDAERAEALRSSDIDDGDLYGRRNDEDAEIVEWWSSYNRMIGGARYEW